MARFTRRGPYSVMQSFLVAKKDFTSEDIFDAADWETYSKHDYVSYDPVHTWVEYINRLIGALSGIPILIFSVLSFWFWKKNKWIPIIAMRMDLKKSYNDRGGLQNDTPKRYPYRGSSVQGSSSPRPPR